MFKLYLVLLYFAKANWGDDFFSIAIYFKAMRKQYRNLFFFHTDK